MRAALSMGDWPTLAFGCGTSSTLVRIGSKRIVARRCIPPYRATTCVAAVARFIGGRESARVAVFVAAQLGVGCSGALHCRPRRPWCGPGEHNDEECMSTVPVLTIDGPSGRSEEHTTDLQSLMRIP